MIIKGTSRGNPKQLAAHLQRTDTNERISILELNSPTDDLAETFRDWQFLSTGTKGSKGLYHANISPGAGYTMTPEQWERAADVLAEKLGLSHQPRTIILHEKDGREHIHIVWARTDVDTMTLKSDSENYRKHEEASLALELEFGHELVPGKHAKRDREKQPEFPRAETTHDEWQQAERTGLSPGERKEQITALFQQCDSGQAFTAALAEQGYILAQGDRRDYVLVDPAGEVHSLGRQIKDLKAKELRAFMNDVDRDTLPTVAQAKDLQQENALTTSQVHTLTEQPSPDAPAQTPEQPPAQTQQPEPPKPPEPVSAPEQPSYKLTQAEILELERAVTDRQAKEAQKLKNLQSAELNQLRSVLDRDAAEKMAHLAAMQEAERKRQHKKIYPERATGIAGWVEDVKGHLNKTAAAKAKADRDKEWADFLARQEQKRADKLDSLKQNKNQELNDLGERHAQKLREQKAQAVKDLTRYIQEEEAARRLLAEEKERQRQRQLEEEQTKKRGGPEPPSPTR